MSESGLNVSISLFMIKVGFEYFNLIIILCSIICDKQTFIFDKYKLNIFIIMSNAVKNFEILV